MKQLVISMLLSFMAFGGIVANDEVYFEFDNKDQIPNGTPISVMEENTSKLLTAINKAQSNEANGINFTGINITNDAMNSLAMIWKNVRFRLVDDDIMQKCYTLKANGLVRGYEVMNIEIEMLPISEEFQESLNQEVTISYDKQGKISDFVISMGHHQYTSLMKDAKTLEDIDRRMQILHYVEQFRTAYCQKDIKFMENVFSDDALIIKGRVQQHVKQDGLRGKKVEYIKQTKKQYLSDLRGVFKNNKYVNVQFDDITVEHSSTAPNVYGITLVQTWRSSTYGDKGVVFLLWDFTNEESPKIYVRTWQHLDDPNGIFGLADFPY